MTDSIRLLTLVRHAKSSWRYELDDHLRPLNKRGLRDCQRVPPQMKARVTPPDRVLCSDSVRTVQTCQAIADTFDISTDVTRFDRALYLADREMLMTLLGRHAGDAAHVMLIGHNPGITDLHNHLCDEYLDNMPTFGVAVLEVTDWDALRRGCARRRHLLTSKGR